MKTRRDGPTAAHPLRGGGVILAILLLVTLLGPDRAAGASAPAAPQQAAPPTGLSAGDWASMQEQMQAAQYQVTWQVQSGEWAYRAPNRAHDLSLAFAADGFTATRYGDEGEPLWNFGLSLTAYGEQTCPAAIARTGLRASRERVEYHWSRDVVEWYANSAEGVKHGLALAAPPAGADGSTVELTFALRGSLTPELDGNGQALRLKDGGSTVLLYDQLAVYDATGKTLPAHMRLAGCTPDRQPADCILQLVIDAADAAYPLTVDPLLHRQTAKLAASDAADDDYFGTSVAISGDTVVVGAYEEDGAGSARGAAYVFERNQGGADSWGEVTKLTASDAQNDDIFGFSVAISGDTVVVGAYEEDGAGNNRGAAYVFERNQGGADSWGEVTKLTASDGADGDRFGRSVAISGDTVIVGAYTEDGVGSWHGAAYVFERNQGGADSWGEVTKLTASDGADDDRFGTSVTISGDTVVVGAYYEDGAGSDRGAAYVFERNQGGADSWGEVTKLTASDGADDDWFGTSVAISGDTVVVGAFREGGDRGAAYVFERNQGGADSWGEVTKLAASDAENGDGFGFSMAISGDTVVVGAIEEDGAGSSRGAAYVFVTADGQWKEVAIPRASDAEDDDYFGRSVAISGDTVVVGAAGEDGAGSLSGAAYVFERNQGGADAWGEVAKLAASDGWLYDYFGTSVAISGDTVIVGATGEDGAGSGRGAAYIFERNQGGADKWGEVTKLTASDAEDSDQFGTSAAISGDTVVVGAYHEDGAGWNRGAAYVFERNQGGANSWGEVAKLTDPDAADEDYFGDAVSISGDTVVVGAYLEDGAGSNRGAAYVFERNQGGAGSWGEVAKLTASDAEDGDYFGHSVSIHGDTAVVGAEDDDGAAYVFERNRGGADSWGEVTKLTASDGTDGDHFGGSVAISGDTVIAGAWGEDGAGSGRGAAYVFERNQGGADSWGEVTKLTASDGEDSDRFGISVAISRDTVVGAYHEDGAGSNRGSAYVFGLREINSVYLPLVLR